MRKVERRREITHDVTTSSVCEKFLIQASCLYSAFLRAQIKDKLIYKFHRTAEIEFHRMNRYTNFVVPSVHTSTDFIQLVESVIRGQQASHFLGVSLSRKNYKSLSYQINLGRF